MFSGGTNGTFNVNGDMSASQVADFKKTLKAIYTSRDEGEEFLKKLKASHAQITLSGASAGAGKADYTFGAPDYDTNIPGAHVLRAGGIASGGQGAGLLAHELFHAYQDKMGKSPDKLNVELDANLFGYLIGDMYTTSGTTQIYGRLNLDTPQSNDFTAGGQQYQNAMVNFLHYGYSDATYKVLQDHFILESAVGFVYTEQIKDEDVIQVRPGAGALATIREFLDN
jgi:hypothetical protein